MPPLQLLWQGLPEPFQVQFKVLSSESLYLLLHRQSDPLLRRPEQIEVLPGMFALRVTGSLVQVVEVTHPFL